MDQTRKPPQPAKMTHQQLIEKAKKWHQLNTKRYAPKKNSAAVAEKAPMPPEHLRKVRPSFGNKRDIHMIRSSKITETCRPRNSSTTNASYWAP